MYFTCIFFSLLRECLFSPFLNGLAYMSHFIDDMCGKVQLKKVHLRYISSNFLGKKIPARAILLFALLDRTIASNVHESGRSIFV